MVILHVLAAGDIGGLERVVTSLAAGQGGWANRTSVAVVHEPSQGEHPLVRSLGARGVEVAPVAVAHRAYRAERAAVADLCRRLRPDVVHTHGYRADVVDAGVARQLGIPTVTTVHGFIGGGWRNRMYEQVQRWALRRFQAVVAVSRPLAVTLAAAAIRRDRLHVIPNAWDGCVTFRNRVEARRLLGLPVEGLRIGWVGRMSHEKGPDLALEALAKLSDTGVALSMIGDGSAARSLRARAAALGVTNRVSWHGTVREAAALFPAFDVLLLSSRTEGTPLVLFEAMAAGVPVVATAVGGVPDVVSTAEAMLVPPADPAVLAAAVRQTLGDPAAAATRARAARRRLEREYQFEAWLERYESLYCNLQRPQGTVVR